MDYRYQGHGGLHSLWSDLEAIIAELERRRKSGHGATTEIIKDLRELNGNLLALQQEWYRLEESTRPRAGIDETSKGCLGSEPNRSVSSHVK